MRYDVDKHTGCWIWSGWKNENGYGRVEISGKKYYAHRLYYHLLSGTLRNYDVVRHKCDNPACVNPEHLTKGSHSDNHGDMVSKGRNAKGSKHGSSKLDEESAALIKSSKDTDRFLAKKYGVSQDTISSCRRGKTWKHVSAKALVEGADV